MSEWTQFNFFLEIGVQNNPPNNANKSNTNFYLYLQYNVCIDTLTVRYQILSPPKQRDYP